MVKKGKIPSRWRGGVGLEKFVIYLFLKKSISCKRSNTDFLSRLYQASPGLSRALISPPISQGNQYLDMISYSSSAGLCLWGSIVKLRLAPASAGWALGCPILAKSCQIILPKKYIVGNIFIKPCTDFQLFFSHLDLPQWAAIFAQTPL